jgi:acetyl-CoA carboxylase carboxyl transferase subunit beta
MSITDWFSQSRSNQPDFIQAPAEKRSVPDGVWSKCAECNQIIYQKELERCLMVCPKCNHHYKLTANQRIEHLFDEGTFKQIATGLTSKDPLKFDGIKPYKKTYEKAVSSTGLDEAIVVGTAALFGKKLVAGVMDFRFIGGSMGSVVGEKVVRAAEHCIEKRLPLVITTASGGARMQEGFFSLMQMAKTSGAIAKLLDSGLPFIIVLTNPTMGGVMASFASLADIIIAEPGALIGFTGPRVIQETIGERLPKGFQTAEFMLEYGLIDMVVHRGDLRNTLGELLSFAANKKGK